MRNSACFFAFLPSLAHRAALIGLVLALGGPAVAQTINTPPQSQSIAPGATATVSVAATGPASLGYQWQRNGTVLTGASSSALSLANFQPANSGVYTAVVTSGATSVDASAVLGVAATAKVTGSGTEVGPNIHHPNGNIYDQVLLQGPAATVTADPGQVTRISYLDLNDDIVQVEFSGAGTLSLVLDSATGPAPATKYNQPAVSYMKGQASIVIAGADETTNVSVFTVGRLTAVDPSVLQNSAVYDGVADLAYLAILSPSGKFGGVRAANASFNATHGPTGLYAPGVNFTGPVYLGNVDAFDTATPVLLLGSANEVRIAGGDLLQSNAEPIVVSGVSSLVFAAGTTSGAVPLPAQANQARFEQNGTDVTNQLVPPNAPPTVIPASLYLASLRPETSAASSTASGTATIAFDGTGTIGHVTVSYANLSSDTTNAYLRLGAPGTDGAYLVAIPPGQPGTVDWNVFATAAYSVADIVNALKNGLVYVSIPTANFPSGELRGAFVAATGSQTFTAPPAPPALADPPLTAGDASRFLTQATFGPTLADVDALTGKHLADLDQWIAAQMAAPATSLLDATRAEYATDKQLNPAAVRDPDLASYADRRMAWWDVVLHAPDQLRQRVAFALSELFVISDENMIVYDYAEGTANYYDLLVHGAFGNFRNLLGQIALNPMMGAYLSHLKNSKAADGALPDENFAREVMQLFTIGLDQLNPDGSLRLDATGQPIPTYNQTTVTEMARVFTGFGFYQTTPDASFRGGGAREDNYLNPMELFPEFHDDGAKTIVDGVQLPAGAGGDADVRGTLDTLFNHANTGPFVARRLIQALVTSNPSPAYVYRVAKIFADNGSGVRGDLGAVIRAILLDYEARSPAVAANPGFGRLKEPLVRATSLMRALAVASNTGRFTNVMVARPEEDLEEETLHSPTVFNFFEPDYVQPGSLAAAGLRAPEFEILTSATAITVPDYLFKLIYADRPAAPDSDTLCLDFGALLPNAQNPSALLDQLNVLFCGGGLSPFARDRIAAAMLTLPAGVTDLDRVRNAVYLVVSTAVGAVQK